MGIGQKTAGMNAVTVDLEEEMMIESIAHRAEGEAHLDTGIGTLL
jgi:hypothetical protein